MRDNTVRDTLAALAIKTNQIHYGSQTGLAQIHQ
jgi:hypothetical protein